MTNAENDPPPFDELQSKRFGRHVRQAIQFREDVLSQDPESAVSPEAAAAVLGVQVSDIAVEMDHGRLGFVELNGERVIRVADLRAAYEEDRRRRHEFAEGWSQLQAKLDLDE